MIDRYKLVDKKIFVQHNSYVFCAFPYEEKPSQIQNEIGKGLFVRYSYDFESSEETEWWYVVKDTKESMDDYRSNHRTQIRKGLKNFEIRKATIDEMATQGFELYKKCMIDYNLEFIESSVFKNGLQEELDNNIPIEYLAAFKDGKMYGYSKNFIDHKLGLVFYETMNVDKDVRNLYANYALIHTMNTEYLNEQGFKYVCDGSRNLFHPTGIQQFLIDKFKFRKAFCKMGVVYNPKVNLIVKCFYPFKGQIAKLSNNRFKQLSALLEQERIRRSFN